MPRPDLASVESGLRANALRKLAEAERNFSAAMADLACLISLP